MISLGEIAIALNIPEISKVISETFPTTRYQGSKRKILPWIYEAFDELEFDTVLDAFGGTSVVSYLLKCMGKEVTYNDILKFNSIIGKAIIENRETQFLEEDVKTLFNFQSIEPFDFIQKTFRNFYYTSKENKWLDRTMDGIVNMNHYHGQELEFKKCLAFYALFQACLIKRPFNLFHRKNLNIRLADVERNFGNKTTWDKSFKNYFIQFIEEVNLLVFDNGRNCRSINQSVFEIANPEFDLVYIDSPYLKQDGANETSDYLKCYHFLEGLTDYKNWKDKIDFNSVNLRHKVSDEKRFTGGTVHKDFDELFEIFSKSKIVLSYKKGGIPSIEYLVRALKRHKKKVYTKSQHYKYALNRQNGDARFNREVLIIGL